MRQAHLIYRYSVVPDPAGLLTDPEKPWKLGITRPSSKVADWRPYMGDLWGPTKYDVSYEIPTEEF